MATKLVRCICATRSADVQSTIRTPLTKSQRGRMRERSLLAELATNEPLDNNRAICARDCIRVSVTTPANCCLRSLSNRTNTLSFSLSHMRRCILGKCCSEEGGGVQRLVKSGGNTTSAA